MGVVSGQVQQEGISAARLSRQVLVWAAGFSTLWGALYLAGLAARWLIDGSPQSPSSPGVDSLSAAVALLWNVSLLILFAALRRQVPRTRRFFAELALLFIVLVCATSSVNWFVQLAIMPKLAHAGESPLTALLDLHNNYSLTYAMEHLGWGLFYGLAALFAAAAMGGGRLETWIRWLFLAGGVLSLLHFVGVVAASLVLSDLGYVAWGVLLPLSTALLLARYRAEAQAGGKLIVGS